MAAPLTPTHDFMPHQQACVVDPTQCGLSTTCGEGGKSQQMWNGAGMVVSNDPWALQQSQGPMQMPQVQQAFSDMQSPQHFVPMPDHFQQIPQPFPQQVPQLIPQQMMPSMVPQMPPQMQPQMQPRMPLEVP